MYVYIYIYKCIYTSEVFITNNVGVYNYIYIILHINRTHIIFIFIICILDKSEFS